MITALFLGQHIHPHEKPVLAGLGLPSHYNLEDTNTINKLISLLDNDPDYTSWNLVGYTTNELEIPHIENSSSHKGITQYTIKLRDGLLELPTEKLSSPRDVYVNILSSGKKYYVKCPVTIYMAFKEAVSEFFPDFTGENVNTLNQMLSSANRYVTIALADDDTMKVASELSITDIPFNVVQPDFVSLLQDKIKKYTDNADLHIR